jgi:hypothetical protein
MLEGSRGREAISDEPEDGEQDYGQSPPSGKRSIMIRGLVAFVIQT